MARSGIVKTLSKARTDFAAASPVRQAAIVAVTAWNLWLIAIAQRDLSQRSESELRGSKTLWRLLCLTNTAGPLAYFRWGRRAR